MPSSYVMAFAACRELSIGDEFGTKQCHTCHDEHNNEAALLENLGRLLNEVKASSR